MTEETPKAGNPSGFTQEISDAICDRMSGGESLAAICRDDDMPSTSMVFRWLGKTEYKAFRESYARAREAQADFHVDEMVAIADDVPKTSEDIAKAKLRIDTRKWTASKQRPSKYGDKLGLGLEDGNGEPITSITVNVVNKPE